MFPKNSDDAILKLIDFGDALMINDEDEDGAFVGTLHYFPAELIRKRKRRGWQIRKGDVYSVGVIAFVLLTGCFPFDGQNKNKIKEAILEGNIRWPKHVNLSKNCKDFILSLLNQNVKQRPTAKEALSHKWLADASTDDLGDDLKIYQTNFHHSNKLQQILIQAIFSEMSTDEKKFVVEELEKYKKKRVPNTNLLSASSDSMLTKESSFISEQEFVRFMISNHVDEKMAKKSTRNLFKQVSPRSPSLSKTNSITLLNIDDFLDGMDEELFTPSLNPDDEDILNVLMPIDKNKKIKKHDSSLKITKSNF